MSQCKHFSCVFCYLRLNRRHFWKFHSSGCQFRADNSLWSWQTPNKLIFLQVTCVLVRFIILGSTEDLCMTTDLVLFVHRMNDLLQRKAAHLSQHSTVFNNVILWCLFVTICIPALQLISFDHFNRVNPRLFIWSFIQYRLSLNNKTIDYWKCPVREKNWFYNQQLS